MIHRIRFIWLAAFTAVFLLASATAQATILLPLSESDLVGRSQRIVTGEVIETETIRVGKANRIMTRVTLRTDDWLKGEKSDGLEFLIPGGTVGEVTARVSGVQPYVVSQQVLVFARANETTGQWEVTGLAQGRFDILRDGDKRRQLLARDLSGVSFYLPRENEFQRDAPSQFSEALRARQAVEKGYPALTITHIGPQADFYDYGRFIEKIRALVKDEK